MSHADWEYYRYAAASRKTDHLAFSVYIIKQKKYERIICILTLICYKTIEYIFNIYTIYMYLYVRYTCTYTSYRIYMKYEIRYTLYEMQSITHFLY